MTDPRTYDERRAEAPLVLCRCGKSVYMTVVTPICIECQLKAGVAYGPRALRIVLLLVVLLVSGCAHGRAPLSWSDQPDTGAMLRVFSYGSVSQGCPISQDRFLTARHVGTAQRPLGAPEGVSVIWSDISGATGSGFLVDFDFRRDLALMQSDAPLPHWYPLAKEPPAVDETVTIAGYDYTDDLKPNIVRVKVKNIVSAHLVLSRGGEPGFSGSCVLNKQGQIVGIFVARVGRDEYENGLAVGVWNQWSDVSWWPTSPYKE